MTSRKVIDFTMIGLISNAILMVSSFIFIRSVGVQFSGMYFYYVAVAGLISNIALFGNATYLNKEFVSKEVSSSLLASIKVFTFSFVVYGFIFVLFIAYDESVKYPIIIFLEAGFFKVYRERLYAAYMRSQGDSYHYGLTQAIYVFLRLSCILLHFYRVIDDLILLISFLVISFFIFPMMRTFNKKVYQSHPVDVRGYFLSGSPYFLSTVFTLGFDYAPILMLKLVFKDFLAIGLFSASYKIISIFIIALGVLTQSLLPYLRKKFIVYGERKTIVYGLKIILLLVLLYMPLMLFLYKNSNLIVGFLIGSEDQGLYKIFQVQLFCVLGSIANFIGISVLQAIDKQSKVLFFVGPCAVINLILSFLFATDGAVGVSYSLAISLLLCAVFITGYLMLFLRLNCESKI